MIPISLKIEGLYSYQKEQTIDFTRLMEGQLFGIFGSVGSGKSTILEAISFALYGETERLARNDNRNYNMMNLKSDELLIDFIFSNFDDVKYRFKVTGKRAGKAFETVNTFARSAYKWANNDWVPLEDTKADTILGLSYENFRRTIIIPQGKFQEFLQLTDKHRTDMLKEIFHLEKYDFFRQAASLERKNSDKMQHLAGQLARYNEVSEETLHEKELTVEKLKASLENVKAELAGLEKTEKEQGAVKQLFEGLQKKEKELADLELKGAHYRELEKELNDFEYCARTFSYKLQRKSELNGSINSKQGNIRELEGTLATLSQNLEQLEGQLAEAKSEFAQQDNRKERLHDYRQLMILAGLKADIGELKKRVENGTAHIDEGQVAIRSLQENLTQLKSSLRAAKESMPDTKVLSEILSWFKEKDFLEKSRNEVEREISENNIKPGAMEELIGLLPPFFEPEALPGQGAGLGDYVRLLNEQKKLFQQRIASLNEKYQHLQLQSRLGEFVGQLHDGEPCPICGSSEHPAILNVEDVDASLEEIASERDALEKRVEACTTSLEAFREIEIREQSRQAALKKLEEKLKLQNAGLIAHLDRFNWEGFNPEQRDALDQAWQDAERLKQDVERQEQAIELAEGELKKKLEDNERYRQGLDRLKNELVAKSAEAETIKKQLKIADDKDQSLDKHALESAITKLSDLIASSEKRFNEISATVDEKRQSKVNLAGRLEAAREVLKQEEQQIATVVRDLEKDLEQSQFDNWDKVEAILAKKLDVGQLRSEITEYNQFLFKARQDVDQLKKETDGKEFNPESYESLVMRIQELSDKRQELNDLHVAELAALTTMKDDLRKKGELEIEEAKLKQRSQNLKTLLNLFRGSGFVNHISSVYLHNLCNAANERFYKLTRQRLRLEVAENNDFQVRDFLNNGRIRSVKTLSGGQMFQASLSLALSLAESVQQQNKAKQNFFFLDEGFGSLDKEALQVVFETLKSLRKENRVVGIISHVEELQQEIDVYLKIENDQEKGSLAKNSWQ